jgi:hypothetical protein
LTLLDGKRPAERKLIYLDFAITSLGA